MTNVERRTRPHGVLRAMLLALPPTLVVLALTAVVGAFGHTRIVFAPLAATAFLVYRSPHERSNQPVVIVSAYVIALAVGVAGAWFGSSRYAPELVAMAVTIALLILLDLLHAPAVSTVVLVAGAPLRLDIATYFLAEVLVLGGLSLVQRALHARLAARHAPALTNP